MAIILLATPAAAIHQNHSDRAKLITIKFETSADVIHQRKVPLGVNEPIDSRPVYADEHRHQGHRRGQNAPCVVITFFPAKKPAR